MKMFLWISHLSSAIYIKVLVDTLHVNIAIYL